MKKVSVELEIPEGYEFVRYGHIQYVSEFILKMYSGGGWITEKSSTDEGVVVRKVPEPLTYPHTGRAYYYAQFNANGFTVERDYGKDCDFDKAQWAQWNVFPDKDSAMAAANRMKLALFDFWVERQEKEKNVSRSENNQQQKSLISNASAENHGDI